MKDSKYEGFTLGLALVDALPVLLFGGSCILIGIAFKSPLFIAGACICFLGGLLKVMWKIMLAVTGKDIQWLNKPFRYLLIGGFVLIILSVILGWKRISLASLAAALTGLPQCVFFALWLAGMVCMGVLGKKLDSSVAKNNWIEQCVNAAAQLCMFIGLLLSIR